MMLGEILVKKGLISEQRLQLALDEQKKTKDFLGVVLVKLGYVREIDLAKALSEQFDMPFVDLSGEYVDWNIAMHFSPTLVTELNCFPYKYHIQKGYVAAIVNPLDAAAMGRAEDEAKGEKVKFVLVTMSAMKEAVQNYQRQAATRIKKMLD